MTEKEAEQWHNLIELARDSTSRVVVPAPLRDAVHAKIDDMLKRSDNAKQNAWGILNNKNQVVLLLFEPLTEAMYFDCEHPTDLH